ncbi:MAG: hypothetical protein HC804_12475, partial [Anaerolineae bacterium]|nr:hypothetical protein [Anaerolineae bacterium]
MRHHPTRSRHGRAGDEIWVATGVYTGVQSHQSITQHLTISQSLTIRGGYTNLFDSPPDPQANPTILDAAGLGRVIVVSENSHVTLIGLQLHNGTAGSHNGGGLYAENATLTISHTTFLHNQAEFGGGLYMLSGHLVLQNSQFSHNSARLGGGGARLYGGTAVLSHNTFLSNTAGLNGGGLSLTAGQSSLQHNQFMNNSVTSTNQGWGGGLHLSSGNATLSSNDFHNNQAHTGGGLRLFQSQATLEANLFTENQATMGGGLSLEADSIVTFTNNVLLDNTAVTAAALQLLHTQDSLAHTTFAGNADGLLVHT